MQRLGTPYGGWWVPVGLLDAESIVYSVGIGGDASFDLELMDRFGCHVWGFDPTPFSLDYVAGRTWPPLWHFEPIGIWTCADTMTFAPAAGRESGSASITRPGNDRAAFSAAVEPLASVMDRLDHDRIDLLKMDIEGAEGPVLDQLIDSGVRPRIICVEYDQPETPWRLVGRIRRLIEAGYTLNHVELWNYTLTAR